MAGPIGHGVAKALREARDKGAYSRGGGGGGGPPGWMWALIIVVLVAAMAVAAITLR